jgi:hypothetical protein
MHKINFKAMPPGVLVIKILKSSVPFCINIKSLSPAKRKQLAVDSDWVNPHRYQVK